MLSVWRNRPAAANHPVMQKALTQTIARTGGAISRRAVPELATQIDWAIRKGELVRVLKGIYAPASQADSLRTRTLALSLADPDAVVCSRAAAALHGWLPACDDQPVQAASAVLHPGSWLTVCRRTIPREFTRRVSGVRFTSRALTAVDLIPDCGADIVDEALRRHVKLDELRAALAATPKRPGNKLRQDILADSRDQPWSAAERCGHQALRAAGVRGWVANYPVITASDGPPLAILDIAFIRLRLGLEIDGAEAHLNQSAFCRDRARDEQLALLGWQINRFTARRVLADPPGFATAVATIVKVRSRMLGQTP